MNNAQTRPRVADRDITEAIRQQLAVSWCGAPYAVAVRTVAGGVTLAGCLDNLYSREQAAGLARAVRGVLRVHNRLTVRPAPLPDEQLEHEVTQALRQHPTTAGYAIGATVAAGVVSLTGHLPGWAQQQVVLEVVRSMRGLAGIRNETTFGTPTLKPAQVAATVRALLRWDNRLADSDVRVTAGPGEIQLAGYVGSAAERHLALATAWAAGAARVVAPALRVVPAGLLTEAQREQKYAPPPDEALEAAVQRIFRHDPRLAGSSLRVYACAGRLDLMGTVDSLHAGQQAARAAATALGVEHVHNYLKVHRARPAADDLVQQQVQAALARDPFVAHYALACPVFNGTVYLHGTVLGPFERRRAAAVVAGVGGVAALENRLVVAHWSNSPGPEDDGAADPAGVQQSRYDRTLEQSILRQLFWLPFAAAQHVRVRVQGGTATLTGQLDTPQQRQQAARSAYHGGAALVDNQIRLRHEALR